MPARNAPWNKIFQDHLMQHDFEASPATLTADMIKQSIRHFSTTSDREVRVIAKMDSREDLPQVLRDKGLFMLPTKNGEYILVKGEGYHDIQPAREIEIFTSKLYFELKSAKVGNSEMQHLDYAFNTGLLHHFLGLSDPLYLQIRGRKYTPEFTFQVGPSNITTSSVQTEIDAGYEGRNLLVLVEAKARPQITSLFGNCIILSVNGISTPKRRFAHFSSHSIHRREHRVSGSMSSLITVTTIASG